MARNLEDRNSSKIVIGRNLDDQRSAKGESGQREGIDPVAKAEEEQILQANNRVSAEWEEFQAQNKEAKRDFSAEESAPFTANEYNFNILPTNIKTDPNYHYFWASLQDASKPLGFWFREGYQPAPISEHPEFAYEAKFRSDTSGINPDWITVREMVLLRVPKSLWEKRMKHYHAFLPHQTLSGVIDSAATNVDAQSQGSSSMTMEDETRASLRKSQNISSYNARWD